MASAPFAGVTLILILLVSYDSVRGRIASINNAGLVSNNRNILDSSRYLNNITMEVLIPGPRYLHSKMLAAGDRVRHWAQTVAFGEYDNILVTLEVYGEAVEENQTSTTIVSISGDSPQHKFEAVQFGWQVWPNYYGDTDTHFFVAWTSDAYQNTGCVNLDCQGFIFANLPEYEPGNPIKPLSQPNGERYSITFRLERVPTLGGWHLYYGTERDKPVGYWPFELFKSLKNPGTRVDVGANVQYNKGQPGPPMGSGFLPDGYGKAASIRAQYTNHNGDTVPFEGSTYNDKEGCYLIARATNEEYQYGGPAGCID